MTTKAPQSALSPGNHPEWAVDPEMKPILARMRARMAELPPVGTSTPAEMRARFSADFACWNEDLPDLGSIEDRHIRAAGRDVAVRIYSRTRREEPQPTLVFFHGGGWVVGDLDSNERAMRVLAIQSGVTVVSVDYCLAPENPFPAPLDECLAVARWIRLHGRSWGIDVERLALGGESAGANLALAAAMDLRDSTEDWVRFLLLIYGPYARDHDTPSHQLFGDGRVGFGTAAMDALWSMYLGAAGNPDDPRAAPLRGRLDGLPPAYLVAGGLDPLRDDSRRLAARLIEAGGSVTYQEYPGVIHGFMSMTLHLSVARRATSHAAGALRLGLTSIGPPVSEQ